MGSRQAPAFVPAAAVVFERDEAVHRERGGAYRAGAEQQRVDRRQARQVADDHDLARLGGQKVTNPLSGIIGLKTTDGGELGEWVADAPERLGGLARPELAAVPDDRRL